MGMDPNVCRRCIGDGATSYRDVTILCPDCQGTGNRRPQDGDTITIGGRYVGQLLWDDDADGLRPVCNAGETLPPTIADVRDATGGPVRVAPISDEGDWDMVI